MSPCLLASVKIIESLLCTGSNMKCPKKEVKDDFVM